MKKSTKSSGFSALLWSHTFYPRHHDQRMFLLQKDLRCGIVPVYVPEVVSALMCHELEHVQNTSCQKDVSDLVQNENYAHISLYKNR